MSEGVLRMVDQLSLPIVEIEGIGELSAASLRATGIHTIRDLLRVTPFQVHRAVSAQASLAEAQSWCQMAALLEVAEMTPQWAEALQRAGLAGPGDLRYRTLSDLREIFAAAKADGSIPDEPTDGQLFEVVKDAMVVATTGALSGTVLNEESQPVPGATVRLGREQAVTDARGRFRISRLALWARPSLFVGHPGHYPALFHLQQVHRSGAVHARVFQVTALPTGVPPPEMELMEVRGDRLPPLGDAQLSASEVEREDLHERDILTVVEHSADGDRVKLVSKLLVWGNGRFRVPYAWFPAAELGATEPGDCYVVRAGALQSINMTALRLKGWVGVLRGMRQAGPRPADPERLDDWLAAVGDAVRGSAFRGEGRF